MKKLKGCLYSASESNTKFPDLGPDLIMSEILPRLPAKCVGRAKKVCKEWLSCISSKEFVMMHCRHMCKGSRQKILSIGQESCFISITTVDLVDEKTMITLPFHVRPSDVWILSSLNGLLCVCLRNTFEMLIWNPLIRSCINISDSKSYVFFKIYSDAVGLYIDSSNDYRVLHIKRGRFTVDVMAYSRRTSHWKRIPFLQKRHYHTNGYVWSGGTFCEDGLYFTVFQFWLAGDIVIIRFDVNTETFSEIGFPYVGNGETCQGNLVNMNNKLHVFVSHGFIDMAVDLWRYEGEHCLVLNYTC
ncbi:putative F-box associated interaction domain, F-box-like domain superfamily [Helianthus anomalus]